MTFKTLTAITLALAYSVTSFAQGGDDPIEGIDIIIKKDPSQAPVMAVSFDDEQLKKLNSLTGKDRPSYMAMVGAKYAQEATRGAEPKGGWNRVFQKNLIENWNPEEKGGSTTVRAQTGKQAYKVTFTVQAEGGLRSKYIGETEKNLDKAGRRLPSGYNNIAMSKSDEGGQPQESRIKKLESSAQTSQIMSIKGGQEPALQFDEADAIFAKRSEVKDAHDRYAKSPTTGEAVDAAKND